MLFTKTLCLVGVCFPIVLNMQCGVLFVSFFNGNTMIEIMSINSMLFIFQMKSA